MTSISRSFQLVGQSYRILMQDKELMVLPLMSGVVMTAVVGMVALGFGLDSASVGRPVPQVYLAFFLMYVATHAVSIFFQAAVVAGATERMTGRDPTVGSALAAAGRRAGPILLWAMVAATVGMAIRVIQDRVGFVGRIVVSVVGAAWSLATLFVVPVLVLEERSVGEAFSRSVEVFKRTWGEAAAGGMGLSAAALCAWLTLVAAVGLLAWLVGAAALVVFAVGAIALLVIFPALEGVYIAVLYRYATEGHAPSGFDRSDLDRAFVVKRR
jgi:hypothetical protein